MVRRLVLCIKNTKFYLLVFAFNLSGLLIFVCATLVHIGSTIELSVTCNIITTDYCFIDKEIELKLDDTLKFVVENAETIKALDIVQGSQLVTLPPGIFKTFPAMEKLFVSDLEISVLLPDRFEGADKLKVLNIYNNRIETIPGRVFINLPSTEEVLLMDNNIETIQDNAFDGMTKLKILRLGNNRIRSLGRLAFAGATNLRLLVLDSNQIDTIEEGAFSLPNLEKLYITNNKLTILSDFLLMGAPLIQQVYLDNNEIVRIGKAFSDCNKLTILSLSRNPIEDIQLSTLTALKDLNTVFMEHTKLKLPEEVSESAPTDSKLKMIWLSGNNLSSPDIFKHLSIFGQLEQIYANANRFPTINDAAKIKNYFPGIKRLGLAVNVPPLCDWITENELFLKGVSVWSTNSDGSGCKSADYQIDESLFRD